MRLIGQHVETHRLGVVLTSGGFHVATNPDTAREPDVAFVRGDRIPETGIVEETLDAGDVVPGFACEVRRIFD